MALIRHPDFPLTENHSDRRISIERLVNRQVAVTIFSTQDGKLS